MYDHSYNSCSFCLSQVGQKDTLFILVLKKDWNLCFKKKGFGVLTPIAIELIQFVLETLKYACLGNVDTWLELFWECQHMVREIMELIKK